MAWRRWEMERSMNCETITAQSAGRASDFLESAAYLPYAHIPGVRKRDCTAFARQQLTGRLGRDGAVGFMTADGGAVCGVALVEDLPWDSAIYEMPMGRVSLLQVARNAPPVETEEALLRAAVAEARRREFAFLDVQVSVGHLEAVEAASRVGFQLVATHLVLVWDLSKSLPKAPESLAIISDAREEDAEVVAEAAACSMPPYSRFLADTRLPKESAAEVFRRWAANSVGGYADRVQVAHVDGALAGYCTWRVHREMAEMLGVTLANLDLTAVAPAFRRKGVLTAMIHNGLGWLQEQGVDYAEMVTHVLNTGAQRACVLSGARSLAARHTLHWHASSGR